MSRTMRVVADPTTVSMAKSIRATAQAAPLFVLTVRALGELAAELGSMDAAAEFLLGIAEANNRPVGVHLPGPDGTSRSAFISPRGWPDERLRGWIGGHHAGPIRSSSANCCGWGRHERDHRAPARPPAEGRRPTQVHRAGDRAA